jgi:subtilisin-like proprotein convertase family protein
VLAELMDGFENQGRTSWQDIMEAVSRRLGHYRFGVSGARENCWTQEGNRCEEPEPDPDEYRYESTIPVDIPDDDPAGIQSTITVPDTVAVSGLKIEIELAHTFTGDLEIRLSHGGVSEILWNREGGSNDDIRGQLHAGQFEGLDAAGAWTLTVTDHAARDIGVLESWAVTFKSDDDPGPEDLRYESTTVVPIPDNDPEGVESVIEIPDAVRVAALRVELEIEHTFVGDLLVVLEHEGTDYVLHDRHGDGGEIRTTVDVTLFNGASADGAWTLKVKDLARVDVGNLVRWALVVTPAG